MEYVPAIKSAKPRQRIQISRYTAILFDDIVSANLVEYRYILAVFDGDNKPCYFVTSEVNSMARQFGEGSHYLGLFNGRGHTNRGASDDWADAVKFTAEALRIVTEKFGVQT